MKRSWIISTLAVVMFLTTLLVFTSRANYHNAVEQPVNKEVTTSKGKMSGKNNDSPKEFRLTESQLKMSDNNNDFACNLFRTIYKKKKDNSSIIVSPISVSYLLGMLNEGADGQTRQQVTDVLGLGGSVEEINEYFKKMINESPYVDTTVTVKTANCINFIAGYKLIPQYQADMQNYYNAQVGSIGSNPSDIVEKINNWCKTHTDGMIPELIKKEDLNPNLVMCLLNAICFKASWTKKFDPEETRIMNFTKRGGKTVKRKMIHHKIKAAYGKNDLCEMLRLPYGYGSYSMYVLLPNKGKTVDDIIQNLSAEKLEQQRKRDMTFCEVDILLPRFTTESETQLVNVLSAMGMPRAFGDGAEFPNMIQGHEKDLYVSMMKQKAKIEVVEEGTKAAAATIAEMVTLSASLNEKRPRSVNFHATRPFVYYIIERESGAIFFMGTYCGD